MDNIEGGFIIEVNHQPISKVEDNGEPQVHASLGPDPAVFKLVDGHLESGNWVLGRFLIEDRSLLPKRVFWFNKQQTDLGSVQKTSAIAQDGSYTLEFAGAPLIAHEGLLFADLMRGMALLDTDQSLDDERIDDWGADEQQDVKIVMQ